MITTQTLKNAARAIEHDLWTDTSGANYLVKDGAILRRWEPETSDSDAFRLMVDLKLEVEQNKYRERVYVGAINEAKWMEEASEYQDIYLATRRAIIMTAAGIGAAL